MNNEILKKQILAGIAISLGGWMFLATGSGIVGSILFSFGLISVCYFSFYLYTGKICYFTDDLSKENIKKLLWGFFYNVSATFLVGVFSRVVNPNIKKAADEVMKNKMNKTILQLFLAGVLCGAFIYIAVESWKISQNIISVLMIILSVSGFILCGGEHCIADSFYASASSIGCFVKNIPLIVIVALGNSTGGILMRKMTT